MKKIIVLLCLGLMGCSSVPKGNKIPVTNARIVTAQPSNTAVKLPVAKVQTTPKAIVASTPKATVAATPIATVASTPKATVVSNPKAKLPRFTPQVALGLMPEVKQQMPVDQKEVDNIIAALNEAIKNKLNDAGVYYNRAAAYFYKHNYNLSWEDVHKAEVLGTRANPRLVKLVDRLKEASGREK